jgi:ribosomal protein L31E
MAVLNMDLKKRLSKVHKPRRRSIAISYVRERAAKLLHTDPYNVIIDPELSRRLQLAARRMETVKIEVEKDGELVRAKFFNEEKAGEAKSKEAAKEAKNNSDNSTSGNG